VSPTYALLATLYLDPTAPAPALRIEPGRVTNVIASADVGAPVERAVPGRAYARAIAADAEQRWGDAEALYRDAIAEWNATWKREPSRALELAIAKAERERQRSQSLALRARNAADRARLEAGARRADALDEARLLRGKLMATRAFQGRLVPALYTRTREKLDQALHARAATQGEGAPGSAEVRLLLCATRAIAGEAEAARLERAHVPDASRHDPVNALARAACAAALGETQAALALIEVLALRPGPGHTDRLGMRDLYVSNDWDRLRGDARFESLFPR
jgi:hypothetical protein